MTSLADSFNAASAYAPTLFVDAFGNKEWWRDDQLHREGAPAYEGADGGKAWYRNGQLHREDGPAVVYPDGGKDWYIEGKELTEIEFNIWRAEQQDSLRTADIAKIRTGIDKPLLVANGKLKLRPSSR